jgi:hypothetical protein
MSHTNVWWFGPDVLHAVRSMPTTM